jgi:plastocyanin
MRTRVPLITALAVAGALSIAACGSSGGGQTASPPSHPSTTTAMSPSTPMMSTTDGSMAGMDMVTIKSFMYMGTMTVTPGEEIMVTNQDAEAHTLTSDVAGAFAVTIQPGGGTAMFKAPMKAGSYPYHCDFHSNMHGTLVVR